MKPSYAFNKAHLSESITSKILDLWGSYFLSEHWEFHVDKENLKEISQKIYGFLDNLISIGNGKFSLLLRANSKLAVDVLTSSPKIWDLIKNNFF